MSPLASLVGAELTYQPRWLRIRLPLTSCSSLPHPDLALPVTVILPRPEPSLTTSILSAHRSLLNVHLMSVPSQNTQQLPFARRCTS